MSSGLTSGDMRGCKVDQNKRIVKAMLEHNETIEDTIYK